MLIGLLIGSLAISVNLTIQVLALVLVIRYLVGRQERETARESLATDIGIVGTVLAVLLAGHLLQFTTWAILFIVLGEFTDMETALYHSIVNFTSLGYGDIVMSPRWRLLGGLEAANGVLMFGVTTGSLMGVMSRMFVRHADRPQGQDKTTP
jgi:hypothetical protein